MSQDVKVRMLRSVRGFTLIELLVSIAIIAVLTAIMLPAVQQAREAARQTMCKNHLKQIALALHNYHDEHNVFPPGEVHGHGAAGPHCNWTGSIGSWASLILGHLDQTALAHGLDFEASPQTSSVANRMIMQAKIPVYQCPTDPFDGILGPWNYVPEEIARVMHYFAVAGNTEYPSIPSSLPTPIDLHCKPNNGIFYNDSRVRIADISDGTSSTAMVCEVWGRTEQHSPPDGRAMNLHAVSYFDHAPNTYHDNPWSPNSFHTGGIHLALADASVRFVSDSVYLATMGQLASRAGREIVGEY